MPDLSHLSGLKAVEGLYMSAGSDAGPSRAEAARPEQVPAPIAVWPGVLPAVTWLTEVVQSVRLAGKCESQGDSSTSRITPPHGVLLTFDIKVNQTIRNTQLKRVESTGFIIMDLKWKKKCFRL